MQWASLGSSLLAPLAASPAVRLWQRPNLLAPVWLLVLALPLTPTLALSRPVRRACARRLAGSAVGLLHRKTALAGLLLGLWLALRPSILCVALLPLWLRLAQPARASGLCSPLRWWG